MIERLSSLHEASGNISLRAWKQDDAEALFPLASDPAVGNAAGFPPHASIDESRRVIREILCKPETYAIVGRADGKLLGCINLFSGQKGKSVYEVEEVDMGYWLGRPFWGHGIMAEAVGLLCERCRAFGKFRCAKVIGHAKEDNVRSRRVLEKAGFNLVETSNGDCKYERALHRLPV